MSVRAALPRRPLLAAAVFRPANPFSRALARSGPTLRSVGGSLLNRGENVSGGSLGRVSSVAIEHKPVSEPGIPTGGVTPRSRAFSCTWNGFVNRRIERMNVRVNLSVALLVALGAAAPATLYGAPSGPMYLPATNASASDASAAEAARLAAVAAEMAQRAAQLAAASQQLSQASPAGGSTSATAYLPVAKDVPSSQSASSAGGAADAWRRRSQQESL